MSSGQTICHMSNDSFTLQFSFCSKGIVHHVWWYWSSGDKLLLLLYVSKVSTLTFLLKDIFTGDKILGGQDFLSVLKRCYLLFITHIFLMTTKHCKFLLFFFPFESSVISPVLVAFNIFCLLLLALSNLIIVYFGIDFFWVWWTSCFYGFLVSINLQKLWPLFFQFFLFHPSSILILSFIRILKVVLQTPFNFLFDYFPVFNFG